MKTSKQIKTSLPLYIALRIIVGLMFAVSLIGIFLATDTAYKSQCVFVTIQCGLFLFVSLLPRLIKKIKVEVPDYFLILFILFCFAHFFCGEVLNFYATIKWWDAMLHTLTGGGLALLCFSVINLLNDNNIMHINKVMLVVSALCFAVTLGVVWEIVEFVIDEIFESNMQRAYNSITGEPFIGREALKDTMKDLILDSCGATVVSTICGVIISKKGCMPDAMIAKRVKSNPQKQEQLTEAQKIEKHISEVKQANNTKETKTSTASNNKTV